MTNDPTFPVCVTFGLQGGYMPDWCDEWDTAQEARDCVAAELLDFRNDGWRVQTVNPGRCWAITNPNAGPHHLGLVMTIDYA